jgi:hypothetical protein
MRDGKTVHIHDYTNQATALQAAVLPTGPQGGSPLDNLAEVNMTDLHGLVLAGNVCCAGTPWLRRIPLTLYRRRSGPPDRRGFGLIGVLPSE